jgi:hypothetical protein
MAEIGLPGEMLVMQFKMSSTSMKQGISKHELFQQADQAIPTAGTCQRTRHK